MYNAPNVVRLLPPNLPQVLSMIYLQTKDGGEVNLVPLLLIFSMPVLIAAFLSLRQKLTFELKEKFFDADDAAVGHAVKSMINYPLIADYDRRTFTLQQFEAKINASNGAMIQYNSASVNSAFFAPWLTYRCVNHCPPSELHTHTHAPLQIRVNALRVLKL